MSPSVLLTGGAGFLGHHLSRRLSDEGWSVTVLDHKPEPPWARGLGVAYHQGDVCDRAVVASAMEGSSAVVHAAFASPEKPLDVLRTVNIEGTRAVLASAERRPGRRVVLVSSTIVERRLQPHPLWPAAPLSRLCAYRDSRVQAEREAERAAAGGLSVAVARPKTFLGPGGVGAFAVIFRLVYEGEPVPVPGTGRNRYQLLDVRDLAAGLSRLALSEAQGSFSFGAARFGTLRSDLSALVAHAGTGASLRFVPATAARLVLRGMELAGLAPLSEWHQLAARGEDSVTDVTQAVRELGWRPAYANVDSLCDSYDWFASRSLAGAPPDPVRPVPASHRALAKVAGVLPRSLRVSST